MAAVTTQKCSERRKVLLRVLQLVQELIAVNESADRQRIALLAAGESDAEIKLTVDKILSSGGPVSTTTLDTADSVASRIINYLSAADGNAVGWEYLAE